MPRIIPVISDEEIVRLRQRHRLYLRAYGRRQDSSEESKAMKVMKFIMDEEGYRL